MKRVGPLLLFVLLGWKAFADGDPLSVTQTVFVPPVYYVGDLVEARLTLLLPEGKSVLPPLALPKQPWLLFRDVQVRSDPPFEHVTIKFIPFAPGPKTLPSLVLGDISLNDVRISTSSLLGKDGTGELASPREQLPLPHTELILFFAFVVLVVIPIIFWKLLHPIQGWLGRLSRKQYQKHAWRQLEKDARSLKSKVHALAGPAFYSEFSATVRSFLSVRFEQDFFSLTVPEAHELLAGLPPAWAAEWIRLLQRADRIRFDAQEPPAMERLDDLDALHREALHLESQETLVVDV